jgi:anti-sigma regulatory factor (Ser/Thr protein kinase)
LTELAAGDELTHQAFLYDGAEQFATAMAPIVRTAAGRGDKVFVAAKRASIDALRAELGGVADGVELHDTLDWHPRPVHRLMAVERMIAELPPGSRLLALGEPVWTGSEAVRREWARYESTINVALADAPLRFVCLYDRSELPEAILGYALGTHPEVVDGAAVRPCAAFEPPEQFVRRLDAAGAAPPGRDHHDIAFDGDPHVFRGLLADLALECGMSADRADELVLAANEVVTNAVVHGEPPISARCWVADGDFVCEIADGGRGVADPFAGWALPPPGAEGGWGLALARRICDALEVTDRGGDAARVRLYVALDSPVALGAAA